jgi:hypothetical protein
MKAHLLIWALTVASSSDAFCQGRDTAFAMHKLFYEKRGSANDFMAAADSAMSTTTYVPQDASRGVKVDKKSDVLAGAAFMSVGMLKGARYSVENEAYALWLYAEGQPIPTNIRRKLRRKHFRVTARDVAPKK